MSYDFCLYRAPAGIDGMHAWEDERRQPLGDPASVHARVAARFPTMAWTQDSGRWLGSGHDEDHAPREVRIDAEEDGQVLMVIAYAAPPEIRALMQAIGANYCFAPEEMALRDPFARGERW
jgi:hypothetical protein